MTKPAKYCASCGTLPGRLISVKHAAERIDVSQDFIRDHITKGTISTVTLKTANGNGTRQPVRLYLDDLERLIDTINIGIEPYLEPIVEEALAR